MAWSQQHGNQKIGGAGADAAQNADRGMVLRIVPLVEEVTATCAIEMAGLPRRRVRGVQGMTRASDDLEVRLDAHRRPRRT